MQGYGTPLGGAEEPPLMYILVECYGDLHPVFVKISFGKVGMEWLFFSLFQKNKNKNKNSR